MNCPICKAPRMCICDTLSDKNNKIMETKELRKAILDLYPIFADLYKEIEEVAKQKSIEWVDKTLNDSILEDLEEEMKRK